MGRQGDFLDIMQAQAVALYQSLRACKFQAMAKDGYLYIDISNSLITAGLLAGDFANLADNASELATLPIRILDQGQCYELSDVLFHSSDPASIQRLVQYPPEDQRTIFLMIDMAGREQDTPTSYPIITDEGPVQLRLFDYPTNISANGHIFLKIQPQDLQQRYAEHGRKWAIKIDRVGMISELPQHFLQPVLQHNAHQENRRTGQPKEYSFTK